MVFKIILRNQKLSIKTGENFWDQFRSLFISNVLMWRLTSEKWLNLRKWHLWREVELLLYVLFFTVYAIICNEQVIWKKKLDIQAKLNLQTFPIIPCLLFAQKVSVCQWFFFWSRVLPHDKAGVWAWMTAFHCEKYSQSLENRAIFYTASICLYNSTFMLK